MTRRTIKLQATKVEAKHAKIHICDYVFLEEDQAWHPHNLVLTDTDAYQIPGRGAPPREVDVTLHDVDITDFLDAEMAVEELDEADLLLAIGADRVADWLRSEGFNVEDEE